jgi:hypothetical protein
MLILKYRNSNTISLAYMSLVHPIPEYGALCRDPYTEGQINMLDHVQKKAAKFANDTNNSGCETLAQHKKIVHICALFKPYIGEWACKSIGNRLKGPYNLSKDDHEHNIWVRTQRKEICKHSFVNRTIKMSS